MKRSNYKTDFSVEQESYYILFSVCEPDTLIWSFPTPLTIDLNLQPHLN